ncbi:MAG: elongation factor G, partial [Candidatus Hydrogenedentes bacterium]|nr:elongation factor G [Candidatus Hydrogenedentota bacterium]
RTKADQDKLSEALQKLSEEDPTFQVRVNEETGQTIIGGMGELHLEILVDRMQREFNVTANVGKPVVAYRESIRERAEERVRFARQTGGRGQFAEVELAFEPGEKGSHFVFENATVGGAVPKEFVPAVEKGVRETLDTGVVAGYPVVDVKATLLDGAFHEVDSSELAFQIAASMATRKAIPKGRPALLEPVMRIEVLCPDEYTGEVVTDFNGRRGQIEEMTLEGKTRRVLALVPLAEMFGYANDIRSRTQGRVSHSMEFSHYEEVAANIANVIMEQRGGMFRFE